MKKTEGRKSRDTVPLIGILEKITIALSLSKRPITRFSYFRDKSHLIFHEGCVKAHTSGKHNTAQLSGQI
jgi:hypothetical protein